MKISQKFTERVLQQAVARFFDPRKNLIVPNVAQTFAHECDILVLSKAGYATEVEIKVSAADLRKDFSKQKHTRDRSKLLARFFYCVPSELVELAQQLVPVEYGILEYREISQGIHTYKTIIQARAAKKRPGAMAWSDKQQMALLRLIQVKYWYHSENGTI